MAGMICASCGSQAGTKRVTRGSFWIELVLWLFFIIPGLIYSIWRLTTKQTVCRACGQANLIPVDSPMGQAMLEKTANRGA